MPLQAENGDPETAGLPSQALPPRPPAPPLAPRQIWKLRDLLLFLAFIPLALLASKLLVLMGYVVLGPLVGWHGKADSVQTNTIFLLVEQCVFYVFLLGFLLALAKLKVHQSFWKSLGWTTPTKRQIAGYLAIGGVLAVAVSVELSIQPDTQGFPLEKLFDSRAAAYAIGAFAISIAPVVEELVFRGLLFAIFERAAGMVFAVVTTAVLFAALHIPEYWHAWHHMVMILAVGLVFSLVRGASGNLAPSIFLHIGYNSLIMTGLFLSTQHFRAPTGLWMP